jgi:hypothetical protein
VAIDTTLELSELPRLTYAGPLPALRQPARLLNGAWYQTRQTLLERAPLRFTFTGAITAQQAMRLPVFVPPVPGLGLILACHVASNTASGVVLLVREPPYTGNLLSLTVPTTADTAASTVPAVPGFAGAGQLRLYLTATGAGVVDLHALWLATSLVTP